MFKPSILPFVFVASFLMAGCENEPNIENKELTRYSFQDFPVYHFQFAFTNSSSEPITIKSIEVFNKEGKKIEHSAAFSKFLEETNYRIELLTHDTFLEGYDENPFDLKNSPFAFAKGTPLERAILIFNKDYVEGKLALNDPDKNRKITVKAVSRVMRGKESINPARYLLFADAPYETLQLKITYENAKGLKTIEAEFDAKETTLQ